MRVYDVEAHPAKGWVCINFDTSIGPVGEEPRELFRHHLGHEVARGDIPEEAWRLARGLLDLMGALYVVFKPRSITIGVAVPTDEHILGLLEGADRLIRVLADITEGAQLPPPTLMEMHNELIKGAAGWNAAQGTVLDELCKRVRRAVDRALNWYTP